MMSLELYNRRGGGMLAIVTGEDSLLQLSDPKVPIAREFARIAAAAVDLEGRAAFIA
jgi:hypothetical protein